MINSILKVLVGICMICETAVLSKYERDKNIHGITANGFILIVLTMFFLNI